MEDLDLCNMYMFLKVSVTFFTTVLCGENQGSRVVWEDF